MTKLYPDAASALAGVLRDDMLIADLPVTLGRARPQRVPLVDEDGANRRAEFAN